MVIFVFYQWIKCLKRVLVFSLLFGFLCFWFSLFFVEVQSFGSIRINKTPPLIHLSLSALHINCRLTDGRSERTPTSGTTTTTSTIHITQTHAQTYEMVHITRQYIDGNVNNGDRTNRKQRRIKNTTLTTTTTTPTTIDTLRCKLDCWCLHVTLCRTKSSISVDNRERLLPFEFSSIFLWKSCAF